MPNLQVLGLFREPTPAAEAIAALRGLGVPEDQVTVLSGVPQRAEILGRRRVGTPLGRIALGGAVVGAITGLVLLAAAYLLYPHDQGAQPTVPVPPSLIVLFETTMLGTMLATFLGMLLASRFPNRRASLYDTRIVEGQIGVLVEVDETLADRVAQALVASGAYDVRRDAAVTTGDPAFRRLWIGLGIATVVAIIVMELFAYNIFSVPFQDQMVDQISVAYEQGPRQVAPAAAVPVQGPVLIAGQPASEPIPPSPESLQRGQVLFGIDCALCHGQGGTGNGPLAKYFQPAPADLTSQRIRRLPDDALFLAITEGRGEMPSLAENLDVDQRWDVVNHVRTLAK
jgi:mono/diheme cytochrome c family protein